MTKLIKKMYYNKKGDEKVKSYTINIPRAIVEESKIDTEEEVKVTAVDGKIIIEKA